MRTATFPEASPLLRESWLWPSHPLALRLDCPAPSPPCPFWKLRPPPELRYFVPHTALHAFLPQPQRLFLPITSKGLSSLPLSPKGPTISPLQLPNLSLTPSALAVSSSRPLARLDALAPPPSLAPAQGGPAPRSPDCARRSAHRAACAGGATGGPRPQWLPPPLYRDSGVPESSWGRRRFRADWMALWPHPSASPHKGLWPHPAGVVQPGPTGGAHFHASFLALRASIFPFILRAPSSSGSSIHSLVCCPTPSDPISILSFIHPLNTSCPTAPILLKHSIFFLLLSNRRWFKAFVPKPYWNLFQGCIWKRYFFSENQLFLPCILQMRWYWKNKRHKAIFPGFSQ